MPSPEQILLTRRLPVTDAGPLRRDQADAVIAFAREIGADAYLEADALPADLVCRFTDARTGARLDAFVARGFTEEQIDPPDPWLRALTWGTAHVYRSSLTDEQWAELARLAPGGDTTATNLDVEARAEARRLASNKIRARAAGDRAAAAGNLARELAQARPLPLRLIDEDHDPFTVDLPPELAAIGDDWAHACARLAAYADLAEVTAARAWAHADTGLAGLPDYLALAALDRTVTDGHL